MINEMLFYTDTHFRSVSPINRNDDILETALRKTKFIYDYADKHKISVIVHGGDICHTPSPPDYVTNKVIKLLSSYGDTTKTYYILGNHDCVGNNTQRAEHCRIDLFKYYDFMVHLGWKEFDSFYLCGIDFSKEMECSDIIDPDKYYPNHRIDNSKPLICIVHSMIVDEPTLIINNKKKTIMWSDIMAKADLILTGHYHPGFGIKKDKMGTQFANPGSLLRLEASKEEMEREPAFLHIKIKDNAVKVKMIKVPYDENAFKISEVENMRSSRLEKIQFAQALEELSDTEIMGDNIISILDNLKKSKQYKDIKEYASQKVIKMCKERIMEIKNA